MHSLWLLVWMKELEMRELKLGWVLFLEWMTNVSLDLVYIPFRVDLVGEIVALDAEIVGGE